MKIYEGLLKNPRFRWLLLSLIIIVPFEIFSFFSIHLPGWIEIPLFVLMLFIFGREVIVSGIKSLFKLNFSNINLLMVVATFGAVYLGQLEEAVIIIVLFALGEALEEFGIEKSQLALKKLIDSSPKTAEVKGREDKVPVEEINVGEIIAVRPGDQIPLDGEIISGNSLIDEAVITGEPLPKSKYSGDPVYAGTINLQGYLEISVTKSSKDTTISKIIELTYESVEKKSKSQKFIEKFANYYTPAMMLTSILIVVIPVLVLGKPFDPWFVQALTILIISCPCALVISTPVSIFSAIGNANQKGVLVKGGRYMEEMGKIKAIALDKTRTLTRGKPIVTDVIPFNGVAREELIGCAAGIEAFSEHPIAESILEKAEEMRVPLHEYVNFQAVPGKGLKGECTFCYDSHHCMGNIKFVTEEHKVEDEVIREVDALEKQGKTAIVISDDRKVKGIIGVTDEIREESYSLIEKLLKENVVPIILTGDNSSSAAYVGSKLGIRIVKAELLPDGKVEEMSKLINKFGHVAMVGDGVNDAPAIAASSVGIVMGAVGSDIAIENSDIALMNDNLNMISYLVGLGRKCLGKIRFNITSAVLVKFLFLSLAIGGFSSLAMAIIADVGVTVVVILNSLNLYVYDEK